MDALGATGALVMVFVIAIFVMQVFNARRARLCERRFNAYPRFCACGGPREMIDHNNGICTDRCRWCRIETKTVDTVFIVGHQCDETTIQSNGRCAACGRIHSAPQEQAVPA